MARLTCIAVQEAEQPLGWSGDAAIFTRQIDNIPERDKVGGRQTDGQQSATTYGPG